MKIALDDYVQKLLPWDCTVSKDGTDYPVRPLLIGDLVSLTSVEANDPQATRKMRDAVRSLFVTPPENFDAWPAELLPIVITQVMEYFGAQSKKNRAAMAAPAKS